MRMVPGTKRLPVSLFLLLVSMLSGAFADQHVAIRLSDNIIHHEYYVNRGPWNIHVLEVDLERADIRVETIKARNRVAGLERLSHMAKRMKPEHPYRFVAAVNGDYFSPKGVPSGAQVQQGMLIKNPRIGWSAFGLTWQYRPFIERLRLNAFVQTYEGLSFPIEAVNGSRKKDQLVLYNLFRGESTHSNEFGSEVILQPLDRFYTGDTMSCVVTNTILDCGNCPIPKGALVLSGHGQAEVYLKRYVHEGDTLEVFVGLSPIRERIYSLIGGGPRIVRGGRVSVEHKQEGISAKFATARHPRTAAGYSKDGHRLFLLTVDGRQPSFSDGMSLYELAEFMLTLGVWDAINLDGGGSTTMVVNDSLVNFPSDATGERAISNALAVFQAPGGSDRWIEIVPPVAWIARNSSFTFRLVAPDNGFKNRPTRARWSCDPQIGSILRGQFFAANRNDSGYVRVSWNGVKDSSRVYIKSVERIVVLPPKRTLSPGKTARLNAVAFAENDVKLSNDRFEWRVEKDIAHIEGSCRLVATTPGVSTISASLNDVSGRGSVTIKSEDRN